MNHRSETQTVSTYLLHWLRAMSVHHLFLVPGSHLDPLLHALTAPESPVQPIIATHELGAAYMADGYGRYRNSLGVVAAIGGPGTSHLMSAVVTAANDQRPLLVISGDVPQNLAQWPAFQNGGPLGSKDLETLSPLMHWSGRLEAPQHLPQLLCQAWIQALKAPYGPVHLQIPENLFGQALDLPLILPTEGTRKAISGVERIRTLFEQESHLLCYVGSGLFSKQSKRRLQTLLETSQVPVLTTVCQRGIVSESDPLNQGCFGFAGHGKSRDFMFSADLRTLLMLGVDLTDRNTLNWAPNMFAAGRQIILVHPTCPEAVLEAFPRLEWIQADSEEVLNGLYADLPQVKPALKKQRQDWLNEQTCAQIPPAITDTLAQASTNTEPETFLRALQSTLPVDTPIFVDAGLSKLYATKYWEIEAPGCFFLSAQTGAMGWALAAAIGASFATPEKRLVVLTGDGCMQMQGLELITAVHYHLPISFVLLNNQSLGSVALRMQASPAAVTALQTPEIKWQIFAQSLGLKCFQITEQTDIASLITEHQRCPGPVLLEIILDLPLQLEQPELFKAAYS